MRITPALIEQVSLAFHAGVMAGAGKFTNETDTVTFISRPMWNLFREENKITEQNPTEWKGIKTARVYGSETFVVESPHFFSYSTHRFFLPASS